MQIIYKNIDVSVGKRIYEEIKKNKSQVEPAKINYLVDSYNLITTQKFNHSIYFKIVKKLKKSKNMIASLIRSYIYLKAANPIRAEGILKNLMKTDFLSHIITSDLQGMTLEKQVGISRFLLRSLKDDFGENEIMNIFIYYLYSNSTGVYREMLDDEFSIDSSISYVRKKYRSMTYGKPFAYVWLPHIYEHGSKKELQSKVESFNFFNDLKLNDYKKLLFFRSTSIIKPKDKSKILKSFRILQSSNDPYDKFVFIRLLEDEDFYRYIKANIKVHTGLLQNQKRELFRALLDDNQAANLGIIYLLSMGDYNIKLIPPLL
jgi:hypothetical protein